MDKKKLILPLMAVAVLSGGCDKKDPIYDTPHPDHGMVTLTTDWSHIGEGVSAPDSYTVTAVKKGATAAAYTATLTGITNKLDHLFEPGVFRFRVYNTPEQITVNGSTVSVADAAVTPADGAALLAAGAADNPERFIHNLPGWFFFSAEESAIAKDTETTLTVPMQQQVRQLTLLFEPGELGRIERIEGALSGAAGSLDLDTGNHASPSRVRLNFSKIASGPDAGKWSATVRLLGIAGERQQILGSVYLADNPTPLTLSKNLAADLAAFNADKRTPLTLTFGIEMQPAQ